MAKVRDDTWIQGKTAPDDTDVRILATKLRTAQWSVRIEKGRDTENPLWRKIYEDENLSDVVDGDAVIEHAWEEWCRHPGMESNKKSR